MRIVIPFCLKDLVGVGAFELIAFFFGYSDVFATFGRTVDHCAQKIVDGLVAVGSNSHTFSPPNELKNRARADVGFSRARGPLNW